MIKVFAGFDGIIKNGKNGFLFDYGDDEKLKKLIKQILSEKKEKVEKIELAAEKTVAIQLNYEKKIKELEEYYKQAIADYDNGIKK